MLDADAAAEDAPKRRADGDVHKRAMERFTAAVRPQIDVRELALQARRFASIPGAQWDGDFGDQFDNTVKMEVNKVGRGVRKIENDYRQNRIVPDFRPSGGGSDKDTADTLDGMHRADSYYFKAQQARDNAFSEAVRGGFGAYRLTNEWADPLDKDNDEQRVNPGLLIPDADQRVFFDPDSKLYDKSDARFAFVLTGMAPDAFKDTWGDERHASWPEGLPKLWYDWFRPEEVVQAEYYEIEERDESLLIFTQADSEEEQRHWEKDLTAADREDLAAMGWSERKRRVKRRRCRKWVLSGAEVLDGPKLIAGGNIPIVPVYGNRDYVDGIERFKGHVQDKMDPQRLYNGQISRLAEISALAPYERPIFAPEQIPAGAMQDMWARGNIDRHPYALANPLRNEDGSIAVAGPIGKVEAPQVPQTTAALLEIGNRDLTEDDLDGADTVKANISEEAMQLAAQRVDAKSGIYLDNMRQSVQREGELYLAMTCEVYVEPGRVVETMTEDGDDGTATLVEDYVDGGEVKTRNNFSEGRYKVIASVQEATATRRDRTVKQMMSVAEVAIQAQDAEGAQAALITASANMDGEGLDEFQAWNRRRGLGLGLFKPTEDEQREMAEQAEQQNQQPDPASQVAGAQVKALEAGAAKDAAGAEKLREEIRLTRAKTEEALASAADKRVEAGLKPIAAANDQEIGRVQRIRTGAEIAAMEREAMMPAEPQQAA